MKVLIWISRKLNRIYLRMMKILKNCLKDKKKLSNKLDVSGKKRFQPGLLKTSTSSPSSIPKFRVIAQRFLGFLLVVDSQSPKAMVVRASYGCEDGNEGLKYPERRGQRRPEEP